MAEVDVYRLADTIAETSAFIDAAEHRLLTAIREFDEAKGWFVQGALSCAAWLSWRVGMSPGVARERVRVAKALASLPKIDEQLQNAELSYSKVRALTRVAQSENEEFLLDLAKHMTAAQLEKTCKKYRQVQALNVETEQQARDLEAQRHVSMRYDDDGLVTVTARLLPDEASTLMEAIRHAAENTNDADGLMSMAEQALRGNVPNRSPKEVLITVDASTLQGEFADGTGVPAEISKRLLCDAGIVPTLTDEKGGVLNVGRKSRSVPAGMRRALRHRDGVCQFPGCENKRWLDAHHVHHWADGGETSLENLVELCPGHHRYLHEYGFTTKRCGDGFRFFAPEGREIFNIFKPQALTNIRAGTIARAIAETEITAATNAPGWNGLAPEYDYILDRLCTPEANLGAIPR